VRSSHGKDYGVNFLQKAEKAMGGEQEYEAVAPEEREEEGETKELGSDVAFEQGKALSKATIRAAQKLGLSNRVLSAVIGLSEPTISRMSKGEFDLRRGDKSFELSVLFLRLYRSLDAIVSGDESVAKAWLRNQNTALRGAPINLVQKVAGLVNVIQYLDSRRARI
jgi:hypothetical protein